MRPASEEGREPSPGIMTEDGGWRRLGYWPALHQEVALSTSGRKSEHQATNGCGESGGRAQFTQ